MLLHPPNRLPVLLVFRHMAWSDTLALLRLCSWRNLRLFSHIPQTLFLWMSFVMTLPYPSILSHSANAPAADCTCTLVVFGMLVESTSHQILKPPSLTIINSTPNILIYFLTTESHTVDADGTDTVWACYTADYIYMNFFAVSVFFTMYWKKQPALHFVLIKGESVILPGRPRQSTFTK